MTERSDSKRRVTTYIVMVILGGLAALVDVKSTGGIVFFTSIGVPIIVALIAGEKPVFYGVVANIVHWCFILVVKVLIFPDPSQPLGDSILVGLVILAVMIVLAAIPCGLLHLVKRK